MQKTIFACRFCGRTEATGKFGCLAIVGAFGKEKAAIADAEAVEMS